MGPVEVGFLMACLTGCARPWAISVSGPIGSAMVGCDGTHFWNIRPHDLDVVSVGNHPQGNPRIEFGQNRSKFTVLVQQIEGPRQFRLLPKMSCPPLTLSPPRKRKSGEGSNWSALSPAMRRRSAAGLSMSPGIPRWVSQTKRKQSHGCSAEDSGFMSGARLCGPARSVDPSDIPAARVAAWRGKPAVGDTPNQRPPVHRCAAWGGCFWVGFVGWAGRLEAIFSYSVVLTLKRRNLAAGKCHIGYGY